MSFFREVIGKEMSGGFLPYLLALFTCFYCFFNGEHDFIFRFCLKFSIYYFFNSSAHLHPVSRTWSTVMLRFLPKPLNWWQFLNMTKAE